MPKEPSPESIARAAQLRAQIDKLTNPGALSSGESAAATSETPKMSPREFIQRQMNKLDRKK